MSGSTYPTLDPASFPLHGLRLIEASAGTGKTYAIANLFLRLVAESGLGVDRILVLTFTRAATEELRGRIRGRLREALQALGRDEIPDSFLQGLSSAQADLGQRLESALDAMDEAAIHTIHGFCQRLLTDHAFESGADFETEFINDDQEYRLQAVRDFWRRRCYPLDADLAAWVHQAWGAPEALLKRLRDAFAHPALRILPATAPDPSAVRAALVPLRARAAELWPRDRVAIVERLATDKALSHAAKAYKRERVQAAAEALDAYLGGAGSVLELPDDFSLFTCTHLQHSRTASADKKALPTPEHELFDLCDVLQTGADRLRRDFLAALQAEALAWCRDEVRRRKTASGVLAPDDLLLQTHEALQGPLAERLAERVRASWPLALIDEFQDTDPLQYAIFQRIYGGRSDTGLIMIGDPKQAIYGFRGADVFTYLGAAEAVPQRHGRWSLDTNWRSTKALVEAVNHLFRPGRPFVLEGAMDYRPVAAAGRAEEIPLRIEGDAPAAVHFWQVEATEANANSRGQIRVNWYEPQVAQACAAEIARLLTLAERGKARLGDRPLRAGDMALLVRDRNEAAWVRQALAERGVGSAFITRDSVFESAEALWLLPLLEAVAGEGAERFLRTALAGPLLGRNAADLERLNRDERLLEAVQQRFQAYARLWRGHGLMPMFGRLLHGEGVPARLLARDGGERALTNLRHLGELLHSAGREVHGGPPGLLRWFRDQLVGGHSDSEDTQLRLESDENLVQVVTVHKSKGLQYPLVFLPYPWRHRPRKAGDAGLLFHAADGVLTLDLGSDQIDTHLLLAERERLAEDMRLLYVALTRAQHRVYCVWGNFYGAAGSAMAHLLHGAEADLSQALPRDAVGLDADLIGARLGQLCRQHPECFARVELGAGFAGGIRVRADRAMSRKRLHFHRAVEQDWCVTSYSALISGGGALPEGPDFDAQDTPAPPADLDEPAPREPGSGRFAFPRGIRAGHCLHGLLEELEFTSADTETMRGLARQHLKRQGLSLEHEAVLVDWVEDILGTPLDPETGLRLRDVPGSRCIPEMGFHLPLAPVRADELEGLLREHRQGRAPELHFPQVRGMLGGFIDLVLEHAGRYYVVDYKSNHLGADFSDYAADAMQQAVLEHRYDLQYLLYTLALHRYLGRRLPGYDYQRDFGGVYYLFLRGMRPGGPDTGVYRARPPLSLIHALDLLFHGASE